MELSDSNIKKCLIFSQKKVFLIFQENKKKITLEKLLMFREMELFSPKKLTKAPSIQYFNSTTSLNHPSSSNTFSSCP